MKYYLHLWGSAEQYLCEQLNVKDLHFWFEDKNSLENFKDNCYEMSKSKGLHIVSREAEGCDLEYKTVCEMIYVLPDGREIPYNNDFGYGYPCSAAEFYHKEGNGDCDCNKALHLQTVGVDIEEYRCGDEILIKDFKITKVLGEHFKGYKDE